MPHVSRRTLLAASAGTTGVAALIGASRPLAASAAPAHAANPMTELPAPLAPLRSHYAPLVGETFTATSEAGTFALVLDEIDDLAPVLVADDENRFNLLFTAEAGFQDGIVTLEHAAAPTQALFVSAFGPESTGNTVQALINRTV